MLSKQWDIRCKFFHCELQQRRIQISLTEWLPSQLFIIIFYKLGTFSAYSLIGSSFRLFFHKSLQNSRFFWFFLFFFFPINYLTIHLMNIGGIMVPSYTQPDVSFMQTANPQRIAARWLPPSSVVLIFMLIIYKDYSNLKNNFLFSLEIIPSWKMPKTML